jgi:hypothetical protein
MNTSEGKIFMKTLGRGWIQMEHVSEHNTFSDISLATEAIEGYYCTSTVEHGIQLQLTTVAKYWQCTCASTRLARTKPI